MPPSLFSPYTPRVGTQILLTDLHYPQVPVLFSAVTAGPVLPIHAIPAPNNRFIIKDYSDSL